MQISGDSVRVTVPIIMMMLGVPALPVATGSGGQVAL
jgi:hypothetical protein